MKNIMPSKSIDTIKAKANVNSSDWNRGSTVKQLGIRVLVPTFRDSSIRLHQASNEECECGTVNLRGRDAFLFFSHQERRMNYLLGHEESLPSAQNPQVIPDGTERKTRLSFELHPDLLMEAILEEMGEL